MNAGCHSQYNIWSQNTLVYKYSLCKYNLIQVSHFQKFQSPQSILVFVLYISKLRQCQLHDDSIQLFLMYNSRKLQV